MRDDFVVFEMSLLQTCCSRQLIAMSSYKITPGGEVVNRQKQAVRGSEGQGIVNKAVIGTTRLDVVSATDIDDGVYFEAAILRLMKMFDNVCRSESERKTDGFMGEAEHSITACQ